MAFSALLICLIGYALFDLQRRQIEQSAQNNLSSRAHLTVAQISQWRQERLDDAVILTEHSKIIDVFDRWLRAGSPLGADRNWLQARLAAFQRSRHYDTLILFDPQGQARLASNGQTHHDRHQREAAEQAMAQQKVILNELHLSEDGHPEIDIVAPLLRDASDARRAVGALYFRIDADKFLLPMIQSLPAQRTSAETLLVQRDGDQVIFLNTLRHQDETVRRLRLPLSQSSLPAAQAVLGRRGLFNGIDHRGQPVLAFLLHVPDTRWSLITKIDSDEVLAPVRRLATWAGGLTLLLLAGTLQIFRQQMRHVHQAARTEHLSQEKKLLAQRFEDLSHFANDIFFLMDEDNRILEINELAVQTYGYTREALLRMKGADLRAPEVRQDFDRIWALILAQGRANYETLHLDRSGRLLPVDVSARLLHLDGRRFVQTIVRDVSQRKATEQRLHYLAYYDELTALPGRSLFSQQLTRSLSSAGPLRRRVGVILLDIDHFKHINDTLGHEVGDIFLREVALHLKSCLTEHSTLSRFSGDQFAVLLPSLAKPGDAAMVAQQLLHRFSQPLQAAEHALFVNLSLGIALYPHDGKTPAALLRNADAAMHHAKALGRGNFQFYSSDLTQRTRRRMLLENGLRYAIERQELSLRYQPQIDLRTGQIVGVEALARWENPELGQISPTEFIAVAEDSELILHIGEWILRTACAQAQAWQEQGLPRLVMAVNLSARQFAQQTLVELVRDVLQDTGLAPASLELEVTESMLIEDADARVLQTLEELKRLGVQLALDDFGTGYSSLGYLHRFPIDKLKIDQSFVQSIGATLDSVSLVPSIIAMARSLKLSVLAEGVESEIQHDFLLAHGCDQLQGYFFSRPLTAERLSALLQDSLHMQRDSHREPQLPLFSDTQLSPL